MKFKQPKFTTVRGILFAAARRLERVGWTQGTFRRANGKCCLHGAIRTVAGDFSARDTASIMMRERGFTLAWNDEPGRRRRDVTAALRSVARTVAASLLIVALASPALAANDNNPPGSQNPNANPNSQSNAPQGGQGGNGGNGGQGGNGGAAVGVGIGVGKASSSSKSSSSAGAISGSHSSSKNTNVIEGRVSGTQLSDQTVAPVQGVVFEATERAAASAYAPGLTSGVQTCLGSASIGGQGPMVGVSFGTTYTDKDCVRRLNADALYRMGAQTGNPRLVEAAVRLLSQNDDVRAALEEAGVIVPRPVPVSHAVMPTAGVSPRNEAVQSQ